MAEGKAMIEKQDFDIELIKFYPRSSRKVDLAVSNYNLATPDTIECNATTTYISPYGLEFQIPNHFPEGALLRISISIPDYWSRKQKLVEYNRIDTPQEFRILAKVIKSEDIGKRGKKKLVLAQTVNIDEIDEEVLKRYLQEAK